MPNYGPLGNYVPVMRNRAGLSQRDMFVLLDLGGHSAVANYEKDDSLPKDVERAIALELILDEPIQGIFAGISTRIRQQIASRAGALLTTMEKTSPANAQKLETLARLAQIDREE
jgi:transcriptional regulator with XRE-family HTH domain